MFFVYGVGTKQDVSFSLGGDFFGLRWWGCKRVALVAWSIFFYANASSGCSSQHESSLTLPSSDPILTLHFGIFFLIAKVQINWDGGSRLKRFISLFIIKLCN